MKLTIVFALLTLSLASFANRAEMRTLLSFTRGHIYAGHVPDSYSSVEIKDLRPQGALKHFMERTTRAKLVQWKDYVLNSGEFGGTPAELAAIVANPLEAMGVEALLEISEVYAIYKGNRLIGYYVEISDHVQAAIYQDGAWFELLTDDKFKIINVNEESA